MFSPFSEMFSFFLLCTKIINVPMGKVEKGLAVGFPGNVAAVAVDVLPLRERFLLLCEAWERKGESRVQICYNQPKYCNMDHTIPVVCPKGILTKPSNFSWHFDYSVFPHSCGKSSFYTSLSLFLKIFFYYYFPP